MHMVRPTLLVVDDDEAVLETLARLLQHFGFTVIPLNDSVHALALLSMRKDIDGLVCDFEMPGVNGEQLARAAKQQHPTMPVFICSGTHPPNLVAPPWDAWFLKGANVVELLKQLQVLKPPPCGDQQSGQVRDVESELPA
jgi:CheY-like chemotaxis protein